MRHLQFKDPLPDDILIPLSVRIQPGGPGKGVYEWELALLAKELLILSPEVGATDFRAWKHFTSAINKLKDLDSNLSKRYAGLQQQQIFVELNRLAHHEFRWQRTVGMDSEVTRYFKIFGYPAVDSIVEQRLGMRTRTLFCIGLAVTGHFMESSELPFPWSVQLGSVTREQVVTFFDMYSRPLDEMRRLCTKEQRLDENFIYAFNPLARFPLVRFESGASGLIIAPVLQYLIKRYTEGLYYDLVGTPGFDSALGSSFEAYVGDVLGAVNKGNTLTILPETSYLVTRDVKKTIDWIAFDSGGSLFIECKTKRLRVDAKTALSNLAPLLSDLEKLAEFAVQAYRTLKDAIEGSYPHWNLTDLPIYPIIVTLEDWYAFGHLFDRELKTRICTMFSQENINASMLDRYPLTICSVADLERLAALVVARGVQTVMSEVTHQKRRLWILDGAMRDAFPEEFAKTGRNLFPNVFESIGVG